jgi:hypothetical protein
MFTMSKQVSQKMEGYRPSCNTNKNIDTVHATTEAINGPTVMNKAARMSKTKTTVELLPLLIEGEG